MHRNLDPSACTFVQTSYCPLGVQSWRGDGRCGDGYAFPNQCNAYSSSGYCCSLLTSHAGQINHGWCGDDGTSSPGGKDHCRPGTDFRTHAPGGGSWHPPALRNLSCSTTVTAHYGGVCICGNAMDAEQLQPVACGHVNMTCMEQCGIVPAGLVAGGDFALSVGETVGLVIAAMVAIVCTITLVGLSISFLVVFALAKLGWADGAHAEDPVGSRWKRRGASRLGTKNPPCDDDVWDRGGNTRASAGSAEPGRSTTTSSSSETPGTRRRGRNGNTPVPRSEAGAHAFPSKRTTSASNAEVRPIIDDGGEGEPDELEALLLSQAATISRLELQCMRLSGQMETTGSGALPRPGPEKGTPTSPTGRRPNLGLDLSSPSS